MTMTTSAASELPSFRNAGGGQHELSEGLVTGVDGDRAIVRLASGAQGLEIRARVAVRGYAPAEGDRVLITREGVAGYVIGVLRAAPVAAISTPDGASASVEGEVISVRNREGRMVVAFDASSGELRIASDADLRLSAPAGRVVLESGSDVEIAASGRVVERAGETEVIVERSGVSIRGKSVLLEAVEAAIEAGTYELRAGRLVERATDAFRTVEELFETRTKHARTLVERTFELLARRTTVASEEDTRVEGKRVLLG
jgi:Protein of unknown function (DUF3540)